ncbi:MAG: adenosylmethionine decarboxylase [bacterium]|nr:adenosylmethionine decarboxylase [bacterium]
MSLGKHFICDFFNCAPEKISNNEEIKEIIVSAIKQSGATIVETKMYHFEPYGLTGIVIITESHFSIHTWPEYRFAAIDFFSCNKNLDFNKAIKIIEDYLKPESIKKHEIDRGEITPPE